MDYIIKKGKLYLKAYSYSSITSMGYRFFWTKKKSEAMAFSERGSINFSKLTKGKKMVLIS